MSRSTTSSSSRSSRPRACDRCRSSKRRCDGGRRCNECMKHNFACTYVEPHSSKFMAHLLDPDDAVVAADDQEYTQSLQAKLKRAEEELYQERRDGEQGTWFLYPRAVRLLLMPFPPPHPDDAGSHDLVDSFMSLSLDGPPDPGFQGKSSMGMLVKAAVAAKPSRVSTPDERVYPSQRGYGPKPWTLRLWETPSTNLTHAVDFPSASLLHTLVQLYFMHVYPLIPLLHRSTFEMHLAQNLHTTHSGFAGTVLLVCALGSIYLPEPYHTRETRLALGWSLHRQAFALKDNFPRQQATLYDLQGYCVRPSKPYT
ncbi:hypothetical protein C8F01DRAFT_1129985 [Mycena amicta]|nr:hypothetical protein C8F01DRAFT_1129985 [Mycena amicta]